MPLLSHITHMHLIKAYNLINFSLSTILISAIVQGKINDFKQIKYYFFPMNTSTKVEEKIHIFSLVLILLV